MGGRGSGRKRHLIDGLLYAHPSMQPTRILGTEQRGSAEDPPVHCPKCGTGEPMWQRGYWSAHCMCGEHWVRLIGAMVMRQRLDAEPGGMRSRRARP